MDSMRSLDRSLPRTSPQRRQQQQSPDDILTAFKAAALSVTSLYKSAAACQAPARAAGYQAAIEDLLAFLDKENLGLCDGEGWRVRQWATERLDGTYNEGHESDAEEADQAAHDEREESVGVEAKEDDIASSLELQPRDQPPTHPALSEPTTGLNSSAAFTFTSAHPFPSGAGDRRQSTTEREASMDGTTAASRNSEQSSHRSAGTTQRPQRPHRLSRPSNPRLAGSYRNSGSSGLAGSKRKLPLENFFDLSGINFDGKDGFDRSNKRRHL